MERNYKGVVLTLFRHGSGSACADFELQKRIFKVYLWNFMMFFSSFKPFLTDGKYFTSLLWLKPDDYASQEIPLVAKVLKLLSLQEDTENSEQKK